MTTYDSPSSTTGTFNVGNKNQRVVLCVLLKDVVHSTNSGTSSKYGVSIDSVFGNVDENGTLQLATKTFEFNGAGIKSMAFPGLKSKFESAPITAAYLPDLIDVADQCLDLTFAGCTQLKILDLSKLETATGQYVCENLGYACSALEDLRLNKLKTINGAYAFIAAFGECTSLPTADLSSLETISGSNACAQMFFGCKNMTSVLLTNLKTISTAGACQSMFKNCTGLTRVDFPALTSVVANGFGSGSNCIFSGCTNITELHFRADAQSVISSLAGYSTNFGATNATIYFDL